MLSAVRWGLGVFWKAGESRIWPAISFECVGADEVAGEVVVGAVGEDEFYFVVFGEGFEVFEAEGVGGGACAGAFDVDDLVDGFGDFGQRALAAGLDHEGVVLREQAVHQGEKLAWLAAWARRR